MVVGNAGKGEEAVGQGESSLVLQQLQGGGGGEVGGVKYLEPHLCTKQPVPS